MKKIHLTFGYSMKNDISKQNKTKKELLHASFFDTNLLWNKEH